MQTLQQLAERHTTCSCMSPPLSNDIRRELYDSELKGAVRAIPTRLKLPVYTRLCL